MGNERTLSLVVPAKDEQENIASLLTEVNHRPRMSGVSKYNAWNRTWAGILDLFGVLWLLHRIRIPVVANPATSNPVDSSARSSVTERA
ncbi:hypothetical protein [Marinobacter vulgaris]|uniref:hypothetical protein n=1 Tax=Marinobacter vulgaris TaxID=1928331 RepID=UPI001D0DA12B|nr:hypothetical protein [Marinobacter vulgaris]